MWYPSIIDNATHSGEFLAKKISSFPPLNDSEDSSSYDTKLLKFLREEILEDGLGVFDASDEEVRLLKAKSQGAGSVTWELSDIISRRAQIGWSTHGHSAVDVNIYGTGVAGVRLGGNRENTEVGGFLVEYLGVSLEGVTKELVEKGVGSGESGWMGRTLEELDDAEMVVEGVDCYHGDFRKVKAKRNAGGRTHGEGECHH